MSDNLEQSVDSVVLSADEVVGTQAASLVSDLVGTLNEAAAKNFIVERLIDQLREEIAAARAARRWARIRGLTLFAAAVALFMTQGSHIVMFWWLVFPLSGAWAVDRSGRQKTIQRLGEAWDPRAVGVLAVVAQEPDPVLQQQADEVLLALLPRVRASDAAFVDAAGMRALLSLLQENHDPLRLAILLALGQIGDERAVETVTDLRDSPRVSAEVRQAAAECLPALHQRVRRFHESATLLRASRALNPMEAPAQLLRPAGAAASGADHLLRASSGEESSSAPSVEHSPRGSF